MLIRIIEEVKKSIDNECFIAALALALTIPDICGKAKYPKSGVGDRYIKWYDEYIGNEEKPQSEYSADMPYSSGELIYSLRNSMLHQGTPNVNASNIKEERCKVDEFVLTISDPTDNGISGVSYGKGLKIVKRMLKVNIIYLCNKLCKVANIYYNNNKSRFNFFQYELYDSRKDDDFF